MKHSEACGLFLDLLELLQIVNRVLVLLEHALGVAQLPLGLFLLSPQTTHGLLQTADQLLALGFERPKRRLHLLLCRCLRSLHGRLLLLFGSLLGNAQCILLHPTQCFGLAIQATLELFLERFSGLYRRLLRGRNVIRKLVLPADLELIQ